MLLMAILAGSATAQEWPSITPRPQSVEKTNGYFILNNNSVIHCTAGNRYEAELLAAVIEQKTNWKVPVQIIVPGTRNAPLTANSILLTEEPVSKPGSYTIRLETDQATITGDASGLFYAVQTFDQLFTGLHRSKDHFAVPGIRIIDYPRLAYRGMHLDVSRHFFPVEYVNRYIDFLAFHKFNYFHWHLTDDQGWRIEIKQYPKLTETGSRRKQTLLGRYGSDVYDGNPYGGYYTQEQIKEVVAYAAQRHISIIPEIDIPGHSLAALSSYPYLGCTKGPYDVMQTWGVAHDVLCAGNDSTYTFMQNVLTEVMQLFPAPYIHIGGDECPKDRWKQCPVCQQRMQQEQLKDEHELQSYFVRRMEQFVNSKGKSIIGWDEILEGGLAPNALVMSWRGETGGIAAAKAHHRVIMTPENPLYLNHSQTRNEDSITQGGYNPIENVYAYDPVPAILDSSERNFIWGAQGNMWSEYLNNTSKLEYMLFPRISALSEVLWTEPNQKDWNNFVQRLPLLMELYQHWGVHYSRAYYDLQPSVVLLSGNSIGFKLDNKLTGATIRYGWDSSGTSLKTYRTPIRIQQSGTIYARVEKAGKPVSGWLKQSFVLNKATGKKITLAREPNKSYSLGGAFSLVDGVQNQQGMLKSAQFLGFNGRDLEATIDLGKRTRIREVVLHSFDQPGSWIYRPRLVECWVSNNGRDFTQVKNIFSLSGSKNLCYRLTLSTQCRFVKVKATNLGLIPDGQPGAGNSAWLFADEIEIN